MNGPAQNSKSFEGRTLAQGGEDLRDVVNRRAALTKLPNETVVDPPPRRMTDRLGPNHRNPSPSLKI